MSLLPVANAIVPVLPTGVQAGAEVILGFVASYFHKDGMVAAGATN